MSDEEKDFVVKDKRVFSGDNQESETAPEVESVTDEGTEKTEDVEETAASEDYPLPEINFPTFIFSLNQIY